PRRGSGSPPRRWARRPASRRLPPETRRRAGRARGARRGGIPPGNQSATWIDLPSGGGSRRRGGSVPRAAAPPSLSDAGGVRLRRRAGSAAGEESRQSGVAGVGRLGRAGEGDAHVAVAAEGLAGDQGDRLLLERPLGEVERAADLPPEGP